jgi:protein TonB
MGHRRQEAQSGIEKRKWWSGWDKGQIIGLLSLIAATLVIPEVRYTLHLEKRPAESPATDPVPKTLDKPPVQAPHELKVRPLPNAKPLSRGPDQYTGNPKPALNPNGTSERSPLVKDESGETVAKLDQKTAAGLLIKSTHAPYPPLARQARIQGTVILKVRIGTDGSVEKISVVEGHPMLAPSAVEAVQHWRYKPFIWDGKAYPVETVVRVPFDVSE